MTFAQVPAIGLNAGDFDYTDVDRETEGVLRQIETTINCHEVFIHDSMTAIGRALLEARLLDSAIFRKWLSYAFPLWEQSVINEYINTAIQSGDVSPLERMISQSIMLIASQRTTDTQTRNNALNMHDNGNKMNPKLSTVLNQAVQYIRRAYFANTLTLDDAYAITRLISFLNLTDTEAGLLSDRQLYTTGSIFDFIQMHRIKNNPALPTVAPKHPKPSLEIVKPYAPQKTSVVVFNGQLQSQQDNAQAFTLLERIYSAIEKFKGTINAKIIIQID